MGTNSLTFKKTDKLITFSKDGFTSNFRRGKFSNPIVEEALSIIQYYACLSYLNHHSPNPIRTPYFPHYKNKSLLFESRLPGTIKHTANLKFEFTDNVISTRQLDGHWREEEGIPYALAILHLYPFCLLGIRYLTDCIGVVKPFNFTLPPTSTLDSFVEYQCLLPLYDYCFINNNNATYSTGFNLSGYCIDKEYSVYCAVKNGLLPGEEKVSKVIPTLFSTKFTESVYFYRSYFDLENMNLYTIDKPEVAVKKYGKLGILDLDDEDDWGPSGKPYPSFSELKNAFKQTKSIHTSTPLPTKPKEVKKKPLELDYGYSRKIVWDD